ncbi:hypothetical protein [Streptomyces sp. NPDC058953]|uniref:hypothetical protein n=1 Tax=unclassified Streptomyces TaxID=2593676 RepID=UPI0036C3B8EF
MSPFWTPTSWGAGAGNPHASEDEITKQDWGEVLKPDYLTPDCSRESVDRATAQSEQTWRNTGDALANEGIGGEAKSRMSDLVGIDEEPGPRRGNLRGDSRFGFGEPGHLAPRLSVFCSSIGPAMVCPLRRLLEAYRQD